MTGFNQKRIEYLSGVVLVLRDMFATKHFLAVHLKGPHLLALCPRRGERCAAVGSVRCPLNERIVHRLAAAGHLFQLESAGMSFLFFSRTFRVSIVWPEKLGAGQAGCHGNQQTDCLMNHLYTLIWKQSAARRSPQFDGGEPPQLVANNKVPLCRSRNLSTCPAPAALPLVCCRPFSGGSCSIARLFCACSSTTAG